MRVRIAKMSEAPDAAYPAASWDNYVPGALSDNGTSLPIYYELEGSLLEPIALGREMVVLRTKRNGIEVQGLFVSSPVVEITHGRVQTQNSVYAVSILGEELPPEAGMPNRCNESRC